MAIVKFGDMVVGARGTLGGIVFTANKAGPYVKSWARTGNPRTTRQGTRRQALSEFAKAWSGLTAGEQSGWDTYAAAAPQEKTNELGETYFASGFNWFVAINLNRRLRGLSQRDTFPTQTPTDNPTVTNFIMNANGSYQLDIATGEYSGNDSPMLYLAYEKTEANTFIRTNRRFSTFPGSPLTTTEMLTSDKTTDIFGTPITGTRWQLTVFHQRAQGRRGIPTTIQANLT